MWKNECAIEGKLLFSFERGEVGERHARHRGAGTVPRKHTGSEAGLSTSGSPEPRKWGAETTLGLLPGAAARRTADVEERQQEGRAGLGGHGESGMGPGERGRKRRRQRLCSKWSPLPGFNPARGLCAVHGARV